jgi:hypothetical protein
VPRIRRWRWALPVLAAGLLAGCAEAGSPGAGPVATSAPAGGSPKPIPTPGGTSLPGTSEPATPTTDPPTPAAGVHRLGPNDSGRTVALKVGETLEIVLSGGRLSGVWTLTGWPVAAVHPEVAQGAVGKYVFRATGVGGGLITFARFRCGVQLDAPCTGRTLPDPGDSFAPGDGTFTVTVRVG